MRSILLALLLPLAFAGCIADANTPVGSQSAAPAPALATPQAPMEIGTMDFTLGPVGNTPASDVQAALEVDVPAGARSVIVYVKIDNGVTNDFLVEGIPGCDLKFSLVQQAAGTEQWTDCKPDAGPYTLMVKHTTGYVQGTLRAVAHFE